MGANSGSEGAASGFDEVPLDVTPRERSWQAQFTWDGDQPAPPAPDDDDDAPRTRRRGRPRRTS